MTWPIQHIELKDWPLLQDVLRYVRDGQPGTFNRYLNDRAVLHDIVDYFASCEGEPLVDDLVLYLRERTKRESWMVEMPVANLAVPKGGVLLPGGEALLPTDTARGRTHGPDDLNLLDAWSHVGVHVFQRSRWQPITENRADDVDTRFTATFFLKERASEEIAVNLAETRARLAVAVWCLLRPPRRTPFLELWPTLTRWAPSPYMLFRPMRGRVPSGGGRSYIAGAGLVREYRPYKLPSNAADRAAPFVAIAEAKMGNDAATAILSAARSLYLAGSLPSDFERTERALHLWAGYEALCHPGHRGEGRTDVRWERLVRTLRLRSTLSRLGCRPDEADEAFAFFQAVRDLASHRADDVLVNLSFPEGRQVHLRQERVLDSRALALGRLVSSYPIAYWLIATAARHLCRRSIQNGWDERDFHRRFR